MTITELAQSSLTSKSSVLRLTKKLGFSGYSEFKYNLRNQLNKNSQTHKTMSFAEMQDNDIEETKKTF